VIDVKKYLFIFTAVVVVVAVAASVASQFVVFGVAALVEVVSAVVVLDDAAVAVGLFAAPA
jgi:hypothetical protein